MNGMEMLAWAVVSVFTTMTVFWAWGRSRDNYGVVDVGWGVVIPVIAWTYFCVSASPSIQKYLVTGMLTLWGIRLAFYILRTRILPGHPEDRRYNAFRADYGTAVHRKFFTNVFLFQGALALLLTAPYLVVYRGDPVSQGLGTDVLGEVETGGIFGIPIGNFSDIGFLSAVGVIAFIVGLAGETIADAQLSRFVHNPQNRGQVCQVGLWKYSRHPNYFFEWVIWMGVSLVAADTHWLGILPGVFMYLLLVHGTGVPFAERSSLQSKGDLFREYQKTTNAFFPWFPKPNNRPTQQLNN